MKKESRARWIIFMLIAGALLRALLIVFPRSLDDDADVYRELGMNLFQHGIYGIAYDSVISPGLFRLPGYPIFLALHGGCGASFFSTRRSKEPIGADRGSLQLSV